METRTGLVWKFDRMRQLFETGVANSRIRTREEAEIENDLPAQWKGLVFPVHCASIASDMHGFRSDLYRRLQYAYENGPADQSFLATVHYFLAWSYTRDSGGPNRPMIALHAYRALELVKGKEREDDGGAIYTLTTLLLVEHCIPDEGMTDPVGLLNIMIRLGMYDTPSRIEAHVSGDPEIHRELLELLIKRADGGEPHAFSPSGLANARTKLAQLLNNEDESDTND